MQNSAEIIGRLIAVVEKHDRDQRQQLVAGARELAKPATEGDVLVTEAMYAAARTRVTVTSLALLVLDIAKDVVDALGQPGE